MTEEKVAFSKTINHNLANDEDVKGLIPIDPETEDLFHVLEDGLVLCKLINLV